MGEVAVGRRKLSGESRSKGGGQECAAVPFDACAFLPPLGSCIVRYTSADLPHPRGELCVSNDTMAAGYVGDPAATAAAFFTDPSTGTRWCGIRSS